VVTAGQVPDDTAQAPGGRASLVKAQAKVSLPAASQSYDITSLVDQQLGNQKVSCAAS
jgi:hypothetical protein